MTIFNILFLYLICFDASESLFIWSIMHAEEYLDVFTFKLSFVKLVVFQF